MVTPGPTAARQRVTALPTHEFVCSEIWGGNQPVETHVSLPGLRGKLYSRPVGGSGGGDLHFLSACDSGILARACLADVAGHGAAVAAVSSEIHVLLRRFVNLSDQRGFLRALNRRLAAEDPMIMTTAAVMSYYPPNRSLSVSYAGHPPALLYSAARGLWQALTPPNPTGLEDLPIGVDAATKFGRRRVRVSSGDRIALFTDGVIEAPFGGGRSPAHASEPDTAHGEPKHELFGSARVIEYLQRRREATPAEQVDGLLAELGAYTGDASLAHDDVTILVVEVVPSPGGPMIWKAINNRVLRPLIGLPRAAAR